MSKKISSILGSFNNLTFSNIAKYMNEKFIELLKGNILLQFLEVIFFCNEFNFHC